MAHTSGRDCFSRMQLRHGFAIGLLQVLQLLLANVERVRTQRILHSPLRVINPTLNPGGRKVEGPAGPGHGDLAPSMISITGAVLRFAVQRLMLSSMVTLIATFFPVA